MHKDKAGCRHSNQKTIPVIYLWGDHVRDEEEMEEKKLASIFMIGCMEHKISKV